MHLTKNSYLIFGISLVSALSFSTSEIFINSQKILAGEAAVRIQKVPLRDDFEYDFSRYSKKEIATMLNRAAELAGEKQYQKAHDIYSQLIDEIPDSAAFHASRGMMSMYMKDRENTISDFEKAIEGFESQKNFRSANALKRMVEKLSESNFFEEPMVE